MTENRKYTAYCGLYCKDCIPSNNDLFHLTDHLIKLLDKIGFEHYAELKSKRNEVFKNYKQFREFLIQITRLKCEPYCFEGPISELGCAENCEIRRCVLNKSISGCWDCDEYKNCEKLKKHKEFHPGLEHNLDMIKKHGIENWLDKRGQHYRWDK